MDVILAREGATCAWRVREVGVGLVETTIEHALAWRLSSAVCRACSARDGHSAVERSATIRNWASHLVQSG